MSVRHEYGFIFVLRVQIFVLSEHKSIPFKVLINVAITLICITENEFILLLSGKDLGDLCMKIWICTK